MSDSDAVGLLRSMVEIPSPSGREASLADFLMKKMAGLGYRAGLDEVGNVLGEIGPASGPLIVLLGHLDTVPGDLPVRLENGRLYGRGAVDAKGALATMIYAARAAADAGVPARLLVVGAVEEETPGSRGAKSLLDRYRPEAVIIGEPSGWSNVVLGYKGRVGLTYSVSRPPAHEARPGQGAADAAVSFWNQLHDRLQAAATKGEGLFHRPSATLRSLQGSFQEARLEVSCRIPPDFDVAGLRAYLEDVKGDGRLEFEEITPAVVVDRSDVVVRSLVGAIRKRGAQPGLRLRTGTSDLNTVAVRWKVPMAAYGPGDANLDHTPDENIEMAEYLRAIGILTDALVRLAGELAAMSEAAASEIAASVPKPPVLDEGAFSPEEEEEITERLRSLGYLE